MGNEERFNQPKQPLNDVMHCLGVARVFGCVIRIEWLQSCVETAPQILEFGTVQHIIGTVILEPLENLNQVRESMFVGCTPIAVHVHFTCNCAQQIGCHRMNQCPMMLRLTQSVDDFEPFRGNRFGEQHRQECPYSCCINSLRVDPRRCHHHRVKDVHHCVNGPMRGRRCHEGDESIREIWNDTRGPG